MYTFDNIYIRIYYKLYKKLLFTEYFRQEPKLGKFFDNVSVTWSVKASGLSNLAMPNNKTES